MNILRLAFLRKKAKLTEKMTDFYRKNTIGIGFLMRIQWVSYRQQRGFAEELRMCINCNCSAFHCSSSVLVTHAALCVRYVGYQRICGGDHCVQRQGSARKQQVVTAHSLWGWPGR